MKTDETARKAKEEGKLYAIFGDKGILSLQIDVNIADAELELHHCKMNYQMNEEHPRIEEIGLLKPLIERITQLEKENKELKGIMEDWRMEIFNYPKFNLHPLLERLNMIALRKSDEQEGKKVR